MRAPPQALRVLVPRIGITSIHRSRQTPERWTIYRDGATPLADVDAVGGIRPCAGLGGAELHHLDQAWTPVLRLLREDA